MTFDVRASTRHIRMSPRKVRLVIDLVRGKGIEDALAILRLTPKGASEPVSKLIRSAVANAEQNFHLDQEDLFVAEIAADEGATAKRGRFGARGRWKPIKKRSCHIRVSLRERAPEEPGTVADGADQKEVEE